MNPFEETPSAPVPLSVLILTFNEQSNIGRCLSALSGWADDLWVLDSFSADQTLEIVRRRAGVHLRQRAFDNYGSHVNWGLANLPFANDWILLLDADEAPSPELKQEIRTALEAGEGGFDGFYINRRVIFFGRWIKHCGWYPNWVLRLFRKGSGRCEDRKVNQQLLVQGRVGFLKHPLIHDDRRGLSAWIARHNQYSSWEAEERLALLRGKETGFKPKLLGTPPERKRFLKEKIYLRLPLKPLVWFLYLYIFRLGFLDGSAGLQLCLLQAVQEYHIALKMKGLWRES